MTSTKKALQMAIEKLSGDVNLQIIGEVINAFKEALNQPAQEPFLDARGLCKCPFCNSSARLKKDYDVDGSGHFLFVECDKCRARGGSRFISTGNECPLSAQEVRDNWNIRATHPHQFIGLTDDEIKKHWNNEKSYWSILYFARAIEQASARKNGFEVNDETT